MPYADPVVRRAKDREYKAAYKARHPGYWRRWKKRTKAEGVRLQRQWRARNPKRCIFNDAKFRAKKNGTEFTLRFKDIFWPTKCPVFGVPLNYDKTFTGTGRCRADQPTLDRWDNARGYTYDNVVVISHRANRLKSDMSREDMECLAGYMLRGPTSVDYCVEVTEVMGGYDLPLGAV